VVQLLLTYGPFHKYVTTRGPLLKNDVWNNRFAAFKTKKGQIRVSLKLLHNSR